VRKAKYFFSSGLKRRGAERKKKKKKSASPELSIKQETRGVGFPIQVIIAKTKGEWDLRNEKRKKGGEKRDLKRRNGRWKRIAGEAR